MSTQQDIYVAGSENRPHMLNKDKYIPWSSRIIRYARSRPNGKMIVDSIENGPYELTENDIKRIDADDQAIKLFSLWPVLKMCMLLVDSVRQLRKLGTCTTKYEKQNLKFLNNLQPEWKRYVTIVRQTKNLHEADFTQIYDFLKMNQDENIGGNGGNQFGQYAGQVAQNQQGYKAWQNVGNQVAHNAVQNPGVQNGGNQNGLVVVPGIANQNGTSNIVAARAEGTRNRNQVRCYNCRGLGHDVRNCTARPRRRDAAYLQTQLLIAQKEEAGIQLQEE
ncbi:retrovirus-related pol polyprotein from transposon TNT 1-94 [Tanacetum coccineum]